MKIEVENNVISVYGEKNPMDERGIGYAFFSAMKKNKDDAAQLILETDEVDTFGELLQRSIRTSLKLTDKGLNNNDVIAVCTNHHKNTFVPHIAAFFSNVPIAAVDINLSVDDNAYLLNIIKPKIVFVIPSAVKLIEDALKEIKSEAEIVVFGETQEHTSFSEFLKPDDRENDFQPVAITSLHDTIFIAFSSGTTGFPKGICHDHFSYMSMMDQFKEDEQSKNSVILCYSSPYWVSSLFMLISSTYIGYSRVVANYDIRDLLYTVNKYQVRFLLLSISQTADLCKHGNPDNIDVSSVKFLAPAGSTLPLKYKNKLHEMFPKCIIGIAYGQTESGSITSFQYKSPEELRYAFTKPTSCGRPKPGSSYKIVDTETGALLGPNQQGELRFKSDTVMKGYYNQDSSSAFDSEGYLKTGDILYYDEDYCFYVVDRIKEMLKYRGYFIAPMQLEEVLLEHPAISEAVVVGIPHPEDVDHPMAVVILKDSQQNITEKEILDFFNEKVSDFKRLRGGLKIVKEFPRTPSNKPKRRLIRDLAIANKL